MPKQLSGGNKGLSDGGRLKIGNAAKPKTVQERLLEKTEKELRPRTAIKESDPFHVLLDCSGSMDNMVNNTHRKIDYLCDAVHVLGTEINLSTTPTSFSSFPGGYTHEMKDQQQVKDYAGNLLAGGSTPLARYMEGTPLFTKRVLIISDGQPDDEKGCLDCAGYWASRKVVCDTVHIGAETSGEALLKQIAEITGGMYIKFTDVAQFSQSIKYMAPKNRGNLLGKSKEEIKGLLGASEVA